jgi:glycosyltransferase involved in cell wall biosynthesis
MMQRTSAVIPVYNTPGALLREAVESVLGQTHGVLELLVIDDGSSVPLTLKEDGNGVVRVIRQPNGGLGAARNRGIQEARGEFIAFLDSDDLWLPTKIEKQEACLDADLSAVACYTRCLKSDGFYGFGPYPPMDVHERDFIASLWSSQFFPPSSTMVRASIAKQIGGYRTGLGNGEDIEFLMRLLQIGTIRQVPEELTGYRVHPGQLTTNAYRKFAGGREARRLVIQRCADVLTKAGLSKKQFWDAHRSEILLVYYRRDFAAARRLLWEYWLEHPTDIEVFIKSNIARLPPSWVAAFRDKTANSES